MTEHKTIKIDIAFPGRRDKELIESLNTGWVIVDKTIDNGRYIYYVLGKTENVKMSTPN